MAPALLAVALAFDSDLVDWRGLVALLVVAAACIAAHRAPGKSARLVAHAVVVVLCAGFFLHVVPGFNNPRVIDAVLIGEGTSSYSKYLNFDKGMAGVLLLGLYVPERVRNDEGVHRFTAFAWRFVIMVGVLGLRSSLPEYCSVWLTLQVDRYTSSSLHSRALATAGSTRRRAPSRGQSWLTPGSTQFTSLSLPIPDRSGLSSCGIGLAIAEAFVANGVRLAHRGRQRGGRAAFSPW
jgi:hypothetical protein